VWNFLASSKMNKLGSNYKKFRDAYLDNILWNVRMGSLVPNEILDMLLTSLQIKNLPEYKQAIKEANQPTSPEDSVFAQQILKEIKKSFNIDTLK
jgi:hypothetical protein